MVYCQQCGKRNTSGRHECIYCSAPLMVVTVPPATYYDGAPVFTRLEEHLLERVTDLEGRLLKLSGHFLKMLDLFERKIECDAQHEHLLKKLISVLATDFKLDYAKLGIDLPHDEKTTVKASPEPASSTALLAEHIIAGFGGKSKKKQFVELVRQGLKIMADGQPDQGIGLLEQAVALDRKNALLHFFIGSHYFHTKRFQQAEAPLRVAVERSPDRVEVRLMLGVICAEAGNIAGAQEFLKQVLKQQKDCFMALYTLGRILVGAGQLREALPYLKRALGVNPSPEMYYLVGHAQLKLGSYSLAARHLRKAIELDPQFDDALYHLGLVCLKRNQVSQARSYFQAAYNIKPVNRYRAALSAENGAELPVAPPFEATTLATQKKVVRTGETGVEDPFAHILNEALNSISSRQ
ncbi:MAG: tetratricopeptide repeat protein [Blastocatellia bacterium]|nr:tetratricopeptide repeat protein [Blastocatellia bacterium]